jgi:LysM repeat protein
MCGTALDVAEEEYLEDEEEQDARFQIPWRGLLAGILTALGFLAVIGWLVRAQLIGPPGTPTPVLTPTLTPSLTPTAEPTLTPSTVPTDTPVPPQVHQVQSGETCVSIAVANNITLDTLVSLNVEKCGPGGIIRPGDLLLIPAATSTPGPTPTVGPGTLVPTQECPILHVVQQGEAGLVIADKYGVSFLLLATANPQVDFDQLQVNQVLQIPCSTPGPTPTSPPDPNATATPIPKYAAPSLLSPPDGAKLTGALVALQWTTVSLLRENEQYAVRLRRLDEDLPVETLYTRTTLVRLGETFAPSADDPVREYSWEVTVVRSMGVTASGQPRYSAASQPSARRTFRWSIALSDGTPESEPAP